MPVATVWAYFRQLSGKEVETGIFTQTNETILFQIGYQADIKTTHVISTMVYCITWVDVFEGHKADLTIYAKTQRENTVILFAQSSRYYLAVFA